MWWVLGFSTGNPDITQEQPGDIRTGDSGQRGYEQFREELGFARAKKVYGGECGDADDQGCEQVQRDDMRKDGIYHNCSAAFLLAPRLMALTMETGTSIFSAMASSV